MSIFSKFFTRTATTVKDTVRATVSHVEVDAFKEFDRIKRDHVLAVSAVTQARAALDAAIRRAAELAESARAAAELAANKASADAARLALEARAAAESAALHRGFITTADTTVKDASAVAASTTDINGPYSTQ